MVRTALRLLVTLLMIGTIPAAEARLMLPERFPPGVAIDGVIEVVDAGKPVARLEFPPLDDVIWERMPGVEMAHSTERVRLRLTAARAGEMTIPAITIHLRGGGTLATAPRMARVHAGDPRLVGAAVCWAEFSPPTAIVGQPVTLRFTCAFAGSAEQIESFGLEPPAQATVLASDDARGETYAADGRRWRTLSKRWTLTFPEPGDVTVRGQQEYVPCEPFGAGFVAIGPRRRIPIPPATLRVRPMPPGGRPDGWNGLVAPVTVEATLDSQRIALGAGVRLSVRVRGALAGMLARPTLRPVDGLAARARDETGDRASDERTFTWDLQPAVAGTYAVTPPAVAYFDPATDAFRAARGATLTLSVDPGAATPLTVAGAETAPVAVATALAMPTPRRGDGGRAWSALALAMTAAVAALITVGGGVVLRLRQRPRREHRGRTLAAALRAGDLAAAAQAAAALRRDLPPERMAAADAFDAELAAVRFGGAPAGRLAALAAALETLP